FSQGIFRKFSLGDVEGYATQTLESVSIAHRAQIAFSPNGLSVLSLPTKLSDPFLPAGNYCLTVTIRPFAIFLRHNSQAQSGRVGHPLRGRIAHHLLQIVADESSLSLLCVRVDCCFPNYSWNIGNDFTDSF